MLSGCKMHRWIAVSLEHYGRIHIGYTRCCLFEDEFEHLDLEVCKEAPLAKTKHETNLRQQRSEQQAEESNEYTKTRGRLEQAVNGKTSTRMKQGRSQACVR